MIILPVNKKIQLKIEQPTAGGLDLSSKETAIEVAEIVAIPSDAKIIGGVCIGDKIMVKAWAIDIINYNGEKFYFVDSDSSGICAVIK